MKKYKLIKEYPGSNSLGTIAQPNDLLQHDFFEKYCEFWEEVVEKDYEILSYIKKGSTTCTTTKRRGGERHDEYWNIHAVKRLSDGEIFTVGDNVEGTSTSFPIKKFEIRDTVGYTQGIWVDYGPGRTALEFAIKVAEKDYEILRTCPIVGAIYSVKRLSDGEVFSVGDLIKTPYTDCTPITGFSTKYSTEYFIEISTGFTRLISIEKIKKQPIFLTHDGKDIFPEDTVWYVNKENFYHDYVTAYPEVKFNSEIRAYFLTEEAAVDYIKKNKVLFITEDGVGIKKGDTYYFVDATDFSINLSNAHPGSGQYSERKYFSTFEAAQYYIIVNAKVLSIEEFWEFVSKPGSNLVKQKALKRLVKERLKIE